MGINFSIRKYNKSIAGKIIITCLLACVAIFLSLYISRVTFGRVLSTVHTLSKPNAKIQLVNTLFRDVVKLEQLQRDRALKAGGSPYSPFMKESGHLQKMLDSLRVMSQQNKTQVMRIDSMKQILYKRELLFLKYMQLRTDLVKNDTLAEQVKSLSGLIENVRERMDNNLVTTSVATRTVIDTLQQDEEKQNLWTRIFTKKKAPPRQVQRQIEQELRVRVDTVGLGNKGDSLAQIGKAISEVELTRISHRNLLVKKQTELNMTGDMLVGQLMNILNDIEADELSHAALQNANSNHLVNRSLLTISIVLVIFIVGTAILIFFIFTDISHSNEYKRQLIAAKEEAEEAGLVKQRFLANMSHELRTPLQTIIGVSEQVKTAKQPRPQDLENIHQSSLHLLQIVNEVLDYSRIVSGKYVIERTPFNMHNLLAEVKEMIQVQSSLKQLRFHFDNDIEPGTNYHGDAFRLKQILLNLLGNAVKFTSEGVVSFSVNENVLPDGTALFSFIIKDTGIGIAPADIGVIFNQFEQGGNLDKKQGTGLGLSIVKALVDIQQGTIEVRSQLGKGTTFTVTIPYTTTTVPVDDVHAALPVLTDYKGHVWVVDDDVFILQLCDSILTKYGIPHTCFSSAQQALATGYPDDISVMFLDIRMGDIDGIALCGKLKERDGPQPVYIALTAQALPDEQEAILQKGFDALVMKPFLEHQFINAIYTQQPSVSTGPTAISLDLSAIYKMTGDDPEILDMVLQSFVEETKKDIANVSQSLSNNDSFGLAEALHKLAGRCAQAGASSLAYELRTMEIALHDNVITNHLKAKMNNVYKDLDTVIMLINAHKSDSIVPTNC